MRLLVCFILLLGITATFVQFGPWAFKKTLDPTYNSVRPRAGGKLLFTPSCGLTVRKSGVAQDHSPIMTSKPACMGAEVPSDWSVFCGTDPVPLDALVPRVITGENIICSVSPDPIVYGDGSFSQIDIVAVTRAYMDKAIKEFEGRGLLAKHVILSNIATVILQEPIHASIPTKDDSQGYDMFITGKGNDVLLIRKWARGDVKYEAAAQRFVDSIDLTEFTGEKQ